jgi:hypothetical protein
MAPNVRDSGVEQTGDCRVGGVPRHSGRSGRVTGDGLERHLGGGARDAFLRERVACAILVAPAVDVCIAQVFAMGS